MKKTLIASTLAALAMGAATVVPAAAQDKIGACLITKTDTNPFFVKMKEGATAKAEELGIELKSYAGKIDGDHETQVQAIETCIADGAKGILLTASDTSSIVSSVKQARDAGLLVIALDTPLDPIDAADATFATDNFKAGELIGQWAKATLGDAAADQRLDGADAPLHDLGAQRQQLGGHVARREQRREEGATGVVEDCGRQRDEHGAQVGQRVAAQDQVDDAQAFLHGVDQEAVERRPMAVDGGPADAGDPGDRGVGDVGDAAVLEQLADRSQHAGTGGADPRIDAFVPGTGVGGAGCGRHGA